MAIVLYVVPFFFFRKRRRVIDINVIQGKATYHRDDMHITYIQTHVRSLAITSSDCPLELRAMINNRQSVNRNFRTFCKVMGFEFYHILQMLYISKMVYDE